MTALRGGAERFGGLDVARGAGAMVPTNSIAGLRGLVGVAHYTAAKHGVVGLMRSLANEPAPHSVRVNCAHPTNVDTPMIQNDAVSRAFRPDLNRTPTRADFAEAAGTMNCHSTMTGTTATVGQLLGMVRDD